MRTDNRSRKTVVFCTAEQLEGLAHAFASEAEQLPACGARQDALRQAAKLRVCATMKRALTPKASLRTRQTGEYVLKGKADHLGCAFQRLRFSLRNFEIALRVTIRQEPKAHMKRCCRNRCTDRSEICHVECHQ